MSEQLKFETMTGPVGTFDISTVRTYSGGGGNNRSPFSPFGEADYADETPWPYEVMVFRSGSSRGLYHAPFGSKAEALNGHKLMVETIKLGTEFGGGVKGEFGVPSTTPEEWRLKQLAWRQVTK